AGSKRGLHPCLEIVELWGCQPACGFGFWCGVRPAFAVPLWVFLVWLGSRGLCLPKKKRGERKERGKAAPGPPINRSSQRPRLRDGPPLRHPPRKRGALQAAGPLSDSATESHGRA